MGSEAAGKIKRRLIQQGKIRCKAECAVCIEAVVEVIKSVAQRCFGCEGWTTILDREVICLMDYHAVTCLMDCRGVTWSKGFCEGCAASLHLQEVRLPQTSQTRQTSPVSAFE